MKIGLFGGTFNPIHFGHINLALELKEKNTLDKVWFIPSLISPFRILELMPSIEERLKMLELALADIPDFEVCDLELRRPPPSFTVDTVREILKLHPLDSFFLLLGEDCVIRFKEWKEPLEIVRLLPLLVGSRPNSQLLLQLPSLGVHAEIVNAIKRGFTSTRLLEISATEIRERIKKRLYCGHFLPGKVLDYIYENQLYSMS